jgi:hypothetical protein
MVRINITGVGELAVGGGATVLTMVVLVAQIISRIGVLQWLLDP